MGAFYDTISCLRLQEYLEGSIFKHFPILGKYLPSQGRGDWVRMGRGVLTLCWKLVTKISRSTPDCTFKDSHPKCFITTNFDKFNREAFARGGESR